VNGQIRLIVMARTTGQVRRAMTAPKYIKEALPPCADLTAQLVTLTIPALALDALTRPGSVFRQLEETIRVLGGATDECALVDGVLATSE
jgi:hypothetical protein